MDHPDRRGLGYGAAPMAHVRSGHSSAETPFEDKAYPFVDSVVSTFEEAWDGKESGGSCKEDGEVLVCTEPCSLEPEVFHVIEMRGAIEQRRGQRTPTTRP